MRLSKQLGEQIYLEPIAQIGHDAVLTRGVNGNIYVYSLTSLDFGQSDTV